MIRFRAIQALALWAVTAPPGIAWAVQIEEGRADKVDRGDLVIPITASGTVTANELVELKAKASGRVQDIYVSEGQMVNAGTVLARLDPVDEQRNVERLQADVDRFKANHDQARIRLREAQENRPLDIEAAERSVEEARARRDDLQIDVDRLREMSPEVKNNVEERRAAAALSSAHAALARAEVDLRRARNNQPIAIATSEEDVHAAEALLRSAQKQLDDARERLKETIIVSPINGMIYSIGVRRGEVIQSGTSGFTGGTILMYIADVARMYVVAQVAQGQVGAVRRMAPDFAQPGRARSVTDQELLASAPYPAGEPPADAAPPPAPAATQPAAVDKPSASKCRRVKITVEAFPEESFEGVIERILPEPRNIGSMTAFDVRIRLLGDDVAKLLSLPVEVHFMMDRKKNVLRVRSTAVVTEGRDAFVYVPYRESPELSESERRVRVQVGRTDGTFTEIISGLNAGDRVWVKRPQRSDGDAVPRRDSLSS